MFVNCILKKKILFQGSARRKKKVVHRTATTDDKKLQSSLKKLSVSNIPGIEEVGTDNLTRSDKDDPSPVKCQ